MGSPCRKRARTGSGGKEEGEPVAVAAGFEAPIFGARSVGQVTTLALEGEDGPLASLKRVASDHEGGWFVTTKDSVLHVSAAGRVRTVATCEGGGFYGLAISPDGGALFVSDIGNHKIRRVEVATGEVTTIAGSGTRGSADGVGDAAEFEGPVEVAISPDGSTLLVGSYGRLCQVCVAAPPPPLSFAPIVVPPSTLGADFAKTRGDASLPEGKVTFLVGDDEERIEHVSKCNLCARSPVFRTMFGIGMKERDAAEVTVSHIDLASFTALVR